MENELSAAAWAEFEASLEAEAQAWERAAVEAMRDRHGPEHEDDSDDRP